MHSKRRWIIFYGDGSSYDGSVELAPTRDVQAILVRDDNNGISIESGKDYYVWIRNTWVTVDIFGLWDYLASPGWKKVLFGRTISTEEYYKIVATAKEMGKTAFGNRERQ